MKWEASYVSPPGEYLLYFPRWYAWKGAFQVLVIFCFLIFSADYTVSSFYGNDLHDFLYVCDALIKSFKKFGV